MAARKHGHSLEEIASLVRRTKARHAQRRAERDALKALGIDVPYFPPSVALRRNAAITAGLKRCWANPVYRSRILLARAVARERKRLARPDTTPNPAGRG